MTNLEKMKKSICSQIERMGVEEFYELVCHLEELFTAEEIVKFSMDDIYTCAKCAECHNGHCTVDTEKDDEDICLERFKEYCSGRA